MRPQWLALFAPLPDDAMIERKPVASPELLSSGKADAIAGWESITVNLSDVAAGMRNVMITLDGDGRLLSAGDNVLLQRDEQRGRIRSRSVHRKASAADSRKTAPSMARGGGRSPSRLTTMTSMRIRRRCRRRRRPRMWRRCAP